MGTDSDKDFEQLLARRRAENAKEVRRRWIMVAVVAFVPLMFGAVAAVRSFSKDAQEWTHVEMADYFARRGVPVKVMPDSGKNAFYCNPSAKRWDVDGQDVVQVWIKDDKKQAKDFASTSQSRFAFGRFVFIGSGSFYEKLKAAAQ